MNGAGEDTTAELFMSNLNEDVDDVVENEDADEDVDDEGPKNEKLLEGSKENDEDDDDADEDEENRLT